MHTHTHKIGKYIHVWNIRWFYTKIQWSLQSLLSIHMFCPCFAKFCCWNTKYMFLFNTVVIISWFVWVFLKLNQALIRASKESRTQILKKSYIPYNIIIVKLIWAYYVQGRSVLLVYLLCLRYTGLYEEPSWGDEGADFSIVATQKKVFQRHRLYHWVGNNLCQVRPRHCVWTNKTVSFILTLRYMRTISNWFPSVFSQSAISLIPSEYSLSSSWQPILIFEPRCARRI